ncbi:MAG TPA: efflux RND transporter periplasmic adaptor subunit [Chthonomonadaceae bacterium]|nr:efflux RND transporter periplasmic adaptor subunit [Chthonomonadaceae bacterium]
MIKRAITIMVVLAVLIVGGLFTAKSLRASASKDPNQYRIAAVKRDMVKKTVTATGILTAWTTVDIKSKAGGRIDRLAVDEGSIVKKGDLIAQIDPSDTLLTYNTAKADIEANRAKVDETAKTLALQQKQTRVSIETALANLNSAKAAAASARARYESAKNQADAQKDLTEATVENARATLAAEQERLNQLVSASHPQENASALAALHQAEANAKNAEVQWRRQKALLDKGFVAQSTVDQAEAAYEVAKATLESAREKMNTIQPELDADLKAQRARVRQVQAALNQAETGRVDVKLRQQAAQAAWADYQQALAGVRQAQAKVEEARAEQLNNVIRRTQIAQAIAAGARAQATMVNAKTQLDQTRVVAPSDGIILKKYVEQGTLITSGVSFNSTGTSIVQLGDISRMYVDVQVDETDVANVDMDQKVDITFDAYPTTPFEGKVIKVDPQAVVDQNVTTVHVRVEVDNSVPSYRLLKPGMNATCEFIVDKKDDVVAVPNEALKTDENGGHYVEIAVGGKVAPADKDSEKDPNLLVDIKKVKRPIEIGLEGNDLTEVVSGLKEGDRVITQTIEPSTNIPGGNPFGGGRGPGRR